MNLAKTPWYWETVTRNIALLKKWGEDFTIRHLVMPNHVECCTYPVLDWIAEHMPAVPVNVMAQFHPDNFCDPGSAKYRDKYAEIARRPTSAELNCHLDLRSQIRPPIRDEHFRAPSPIHHDCDVRNVSRPNIPNDMTGALLIAVNALGQEPAGVRPKRSHGQAAALILQGDGAGMGKLVSP